MAIANLAGADGIDGNLSNLTHAPSATTLVGNGGGKEMQIAQLVV